MKVTDELIDNLSKLARLEFIDGEKEEIKRDLEQMITFIETLNEIDTIGVQPLLHMNENVNVLREDEIKGRITREDAFKNAPLHNEQFFMVPKVIPSKVNLSKGSTKII